MAQHDLALNVGLDPAGADTYLPVGAGRVGMTTGGSVALRSVVDAARWPVATGTYSWASPTAPACPGGTGLPGIYGRALYFQVALRRSRSGWKFIKWLMEPGPAGGVVRRQRLPARQR